MIEYTQLESPGKKGKEEYLEAGADYVISSIDELKELIRKINARLVFRDSPKG